jgi:hypothetical protein
VIDEGVFAKGIGFVYELLSTLQAAAPQVSVIVLLYKQSKYKGTNTDTCPAVPTSLNTLGKPLI